MVISKCPLVTLESLCGSPGEPRLKVVTEGAVPTAAVAAMAGGALAAGGGGAAGGAAGYDAAQRAAIAHTIHSSGDDSDFR